MSSRSRTLVKNPIVSAERIPDEAAPFAGKPAKARSSTQLQGLTFERRACKRLADDLDCELIKGPWIRYKKARGKPRFCQPDAFLVDEAGKRIYVIEAKRTLRPFVAKHKLQLLYGPLAALLYPGYDIILVQLCKHLRRGPKPKELCEIEDLKTCNSYKIIHMPLP